MQNRHLDSVLSNHLSIKVQEENNTLQSMDMIRPLQYQQKKINKHKPRSKHDLGEQIAKKIFFPVLPPYHFHSPLQNQNEV